MGASQSNQGSKMKVCVYLAWIAPTARAKQKTTAVTDCIVMLRNEEWMRTEGNPESFIMKH